MYIPREIVADILNRADVSIDTRLAFRDYGVVPRKLQVDDAFTRKLDVLCRRRTHMYMLYTKRKIKTMCLERIIVKGEHRHIYISIFITLFWDNTTHELRYTMRSINFPDCLLENPPLASKVYCSNIHTGEIVYVDT